MAGRFEHAQLGRHQGQLWPDATLARHGVIPLTNLPAGLTAPKQPDGEPSAFLFRFYEDAMQDYSIDTR